MSKPTFIYKIVPSATPPPNPLPEKLPLSDLDAASGFIHLSTALQVLGTVKHFFTDDPKVYLLQLKYDDVEQHIKWEDPKATVCGDRAGDGLFPHLYNGGIIGRGEVNDVFVLEKSETGWDKSFEKAKSWLIY